jgi:hypothetical protein
MTLQITGVKAAAFLMSKGLSRDAAIAVCAVLWFESKLNPGPQGVQSTETPGALNPSGAYGIASWNGPRQQALADFAKTKNLPVDQLETQLWFVLNEAANKYPRTWEAITGAGTFEQIIPVFVADYENPKDHAREIEGSLAFAKELAPLVPATVQAEAPQPAQPAPAPQPAPPQPPAPKPQPMVLDPELRAMEACYEILNSLDNPAAFHRVLAYLYARFVA